MAKKSQSSSSSSGNYGTVKFLGFCALALAALAGVLSFTFGLLGYVGVSISWGDTAAGICSLVSQVALLICVGIAAWDYAKRKGKAIKIIYVIALILCILGLVGIGFVAL